MTKLSWRIRREALDDRRERQIQVRIEVVAICISAIAAMLSAFTGWLAYSQSKLAQEQSELAREQLHTARRQLELSIAPFITTEINTRTLASGYIPVTIKNSGAGPAQNVRFAIATGVASADFTKFKNPGGDWSATYSIGQNGGVLTPAASFRHVLTQYPSQITTGKLDLILMVELQHSSLLGETVETRACWRLRASPDLSRARVVGYCDFPAAENRPERRPLN